MTTEKRAEIKRDTARLKGRITLFINQFIVPIMEAYSR
jgi:hypothetical protein